MPYIPRHNGKRLKGLLKVKMRKNPDFDEKINGYIEKLNKPKIGGFGDLKVIDFPPFPRSAIGYTISNQLREYLEGKV